MEIYMDHPHHGAHVVHSHGEAAEMEKRGWKRRPEKVVAPVVEPVVEAESAPKKKWSRQ